MAHPIEPFPTAIRAALILENMPAITGADADVPDAATLVLLTKYK